MSRPIPLVMDPGSFAEAARAQAAETHAHSEELLQPLPGHAPAWIRVGDTGPGLPPKAREHLFMAFQGSARKGGSGLGLAIAAELVRGHGGRLDLVRSDAEGTEFMLHLPRSGGIDEV